MTTGPSEVLVTVARTSPESPLPTAMDFLPFFILKSASWTFAMTSIRRRGVSLLSITISVTTGSSGCARTGRDIAIIRIMGTNPSALFIGHLTIASIFDC